MASVVVDPLAQDPRFKKMSYEGQTILRQQLMINKLAADPRFVSMSPGARQQVAQTVLSQQAKKGPALVSFSGQVTDEDRAAFDQGLLSAQDPDAAYKSAYIIGERLANGQVDPATIQEAKNWVVLNRVATESLLAKVAFGAKDAIEVMFGTDDTFGNDLRFHTEDYRKLASWMTQQMPGKLGANLRAGADIAGGLTAFTETALLNVIGVGTLAAPGLFTKGIWNAINLGKAASASKIGISMLGKALPMAIEAVGSGTVDVLRQLPELIEKGQIYGPEKMFTGLAATFGEGVAFDFVFNVAKDVYKYLARPTAKAIRGLDLTDMDTLKPYLDATGNFTPEKFSGYLNEVLSGRVPKEVFDQLDDEGKAQFGDLVNMMKTNAEVPNFDVHSPQGFKMFAKAVGFDAQITDAGKVNILEGSKVVDSFGTPSEAVSWMVAKGPASQGLVGDAGIAGPFESRLRTKMQTGLKLSDLSDSQLASLVNPTFNGKIPEGNVTRVAQEVLTRSGALRLPKISAVPEDEFLSRFMINSHPTNRPYGLGTNELIVPKTISQQRTKNVLFNYLDLYARENNLARKNWLSVAQAGKDLNFESLAAAASRMGAELTQQGDAYVLKLGNQVQKFHELTELNQVVTRALVDNGILREEEIIEQVQRSTGFVLTKDKDPLGIVPHRWVLRDSVSGREIDQADDLNKILYGKMDFSPKLPETLAPDLVVEPNGKLVLNKTVALGPVSSLRGLMKDFGPAENFYKGKEKPTLEKIFPDGSTLTYKAHTAHYAVEVPKLGVRQEFTSTKKAEQFLDKIGQDSGLMTRMAERRGFKVVALPDGSIGFNNGTDILSAKTPEDAERILRSSPDSPAHENLIQFLDQETEDTIRAKTVEKLSTASEEIFDDAKPALDMYRSTLKANIGTLASPAMSSFEELAKLYKDPKITEFARQYLVRKRFVSQQSYVAAGSVQRMLSIDGKLAKKSELDLLGKLIQYDEPNWDKAARTLMANEGFVLKDEHKQMLRLSQQYLKHVGTYFGIDPIRFLNQYAPHIRNVLDSEGGMATMLSKLSREQVLERIFGQQWQNIPEVKFLSKNARLDSFLDANSQSNLMNVMMWYTEHGLKEKFLGNYLDRMKSWMDELRKSGANDVLLGRIGGFYAAASGGESDYLGAVITNSSITGSKKVAEAMTKLSAVFPKGSPLAKKFSDLAESSISTNYLDQASSAMSYATLGWRPFRAMANMTQYMNTFSVYGHYAEDAVAAVDAEGADYIKKLFNKGILNERIFAASGGGTGKFQTFLDKSLKWQQNSEYLTRAWTAKSVELAFDDTSAKLAKGLLGTGTDALKKFLKLSNLDILDETDQAKIAGFLKAGKPEAAKDLAQASVVRIMMFDYGKENYPMLFKGTMGKLFGKFGVYPVGQIDLYRRILRSADWGTRAIRGLRLMGTSLAVYEGFRQVGIDYSGFLFTDPFSFSGGPLYQAAQDLLKVGSTGPEGALARGSLARNFLPVTSKGLNVPRLLVPGALQLQGLGKAGTALVGGNYWEALLDGLSAPRDTGYIGPGHWYID